MRKLLEFSFRYAKLVILLVILITAAFAFAAIHIDINPSPETLIPSDDSSQLLVEKYGNSSADLGYFFIAVEADNPYTIEKLASFDTAINRIETLPGIKPGLTPFNAISFEKNMGRLSAVNTSKDKKAPATEEEIEDFKKRIIGNPFYTNNIISEDGKMLCAVFPSEVDTDADLFENSFRPIKKELEKYFKVYYTGEIPLTYQSNLYLTRDFFKLIILALVFVMVTFYIGFNAKRSIFLPVMVVVIGIIWTLGIMSLAGFKMTIISIIIPPLLLAIGSSYTIHILSQFFREFSSSETREWVIDAILHISKTIMMATLTTVISFLALLATSLEQLQDFGLSASIGISVCFILSITLLPAMFAALPLPSQKQKKGIRYGLFTKILKNLGSFVYRFRYLIVVVFILIIAAFGLLIPHIAKQSDYMSYFPKNDPVLNNTMTILKKVGGYQQLNITMTAPEDEKNYFLRNDVLKEISEFENKILDHPDVTTVSSVSYYIKKLNQIMTGEDEIPENRGLIMLLSRYLHLLNQEGESSSSFFQQMANEDFTTVTLSFKIYDSRHNRFISEETLHSLMDTIEAEIAACIPEELHPEVWGYDLRYLYLSQRLFRDQRISTFLSVFLVFIVTLIAFRSFKYSISALIPLACGIMLNYIIMVLLRIPLDMITLMVTNIAIGVGIDDAIHYLLQFRLIYRPGHLKSSILQTHVVTGRPIMHTTFAIVVGFSVLVFASYKGISYFGLLTSITLFFAMAGTLIVLPAVMAVFIEIWPEKLRLKK